MATTRRLSAVAALAAVAFVLTACQTAGASPGAEGGDSGTQAGVSAQAQEALNASYAGVGSDLSDLTPVTPEKGVNFYVISCGEILPSCSRGAAAMKDAAEAAGWDATIVDGKLSPDGFAAAVRQAIAGGATAMSMIGIGCSAAQGAFSEAAEAGITVIGNAGADDCDPKVWTGNRLWMPNTTTQDFWETLGATQAEYAWGKTDGNVKAIMLHLSSEAWGGWIVDGFNKRLSELGSGETVATVDLSNPEIGDGSFVQKVTTVVLSHPEANVLISPNDGWMSNGLSASLVSADLAKQLTVISRGGDEAVLDMIRQGGSGVDATVASSVPWGAWGAVDTAIRLLAGQQPIPSGETIQIVDADHNLPDSGWYTPGVDFESKYKAAWGVG